MAYTRRQVFVALLAGGFLVQGLTSPAGFQALIACAAGVRSSSNYLQLGLQVLMLALGLWMAKQAFTEGVFLSRRRVVLLAVVAALVVLSPLLLYFPQIVVGYLGMPRRYHSY